MQTDRAKVVNRPAPLRVAAAAPAHAQRSPGPAAARGGAIGALRAASPHAAAERETHPSPLRRTLAAGTLQPRLIVGPPDDAYEREAERAADAVMAPERGPTAGGDRITRPGVAASLMRVVQRGPGEVEPSKRTDDARTTPVQTASARPAPTVVPAGVESTIGQMTRGGTPLPTAVRERFERRFGYDFGAVRTHTGPDAATAAAELGARAFTVGDHVVFGAGEYQPSSAQGQRLLAHELTHVVQQAADTTRVVRRREIVTWQLGDTRYFKTRSGRTVELPADMTAQQAARLEDEALAAEQRLARLPEPRPVPKVRKPAPGPKKAPSPKSRPRRKRTVGGKARPKSAHAAAALLEAVGTGAVAQYLAAKGALVAAQGAAKLSRLKANEQTHEDGGEKLNKTEAAVVVPRSEEQASGNAGQVGAVGDRPAPVVDQSTAKRTLEQSLTANVPRSIGALDNFRRDKKAQHTGAAVIAVVQAEKDAVVGTFGDLRATPPPVPSDHEPTELPPAEQAPPTPVMHLGRGAIAALPKELTDVSIYTQQADARLKEEGVTQEQLDMVDKGDLAEANKERKGMALQASAGPAAAQKLAQDERARVDRELAHDEQQERGALAARRRSALTTTGTKQKDTKTALEKKREAVATEINGRYKTAQDKVTTRLTELEAQSMKRFDEGSAAAAKAFEDDVNRQLQAYKDDRYSGWFGDLRRAKDWLLGMDDLPRVKAIFEGNRAAFVARVNTLVEDIAADNARVVRECREELLDARKQIDEYVAGLEPALKDVGQKAAKEMEERLDALDKEIGRKEEALRNSLKDKQAAAIRAIDEKIEKMKESMSGALAKLGRLLLLAARKFFTWALEKAGFSLSTIESVINKGTVVLKAIFTGPIRFVSNLMGAAKSGFASFAKNFLRHLKDAVFEWLTGALTGIVLPQSWTPRAIVAVVLQLVGVSWENLKKRLVLLVPAPVVEKLQTTFGLVKTLVVEGPIAAWEEIKDMAGELKDRFVGAVSDWVKWKVVEEAVKAVLALFIPGAGMLRAIVGIYDTIVFFIQKARDIAQMIGRFLGSIAEIAAGNIGAAAQALEDGLARGLTLVIAFLAKLLRLGGITEKIRGVLGAVRAKVDGVLDRVARWIVAQARRLGHLALRGAKGVARRFRPEDVGRSLTFASRGASHRLWVEVRSGTAVVMVASTPSAVERFLDGPEVRAAVGRDPTLAVVVGRALKVAATSVVNARRALAVLGAEEVDPAKFESADAAVEAKERELLPLLQRIFDALTPEERTTAQAAVLRRHIAGLLVRLRRVHRAQQTDADAPRRERLAPWLPQAIAETASGLREDHQLAADATSEREFVSLAQSADAHEATLRRLEREYALSAENPANVGSSLVRFRTVAPARIKPAPYQKHFQGGTHQRRDNAIRSGEGQYKGDPPAIWAMEQAVLHEAVGGAHRLIDRGGGAFFVWAVRRRVGYVARTGEENTVVRVEVTTTGDVHSHPE